MTEVLIITDGSYGVSILQSDTGRWFCTGCETGFTRAEDAIHEAARSVSAVGGVPVRDVLWRTQPTASYQTAPIRVQRALIALITNLNPVRARFANLRPGGYDRE